MRRFFPKISAILFGAIFLLGGATTVFGADNYFFWYNKKAGLVFGEEGPVQVSGPYTNLASCQSAQQEKSADSSFRVNFCHTGTSLQAEQTLASGQSAANAKQRDLVAALSNVPSKDPILDKLHCGIPLPGFAEYSIYDCVPTLVYYVVYIPASWLLTGGGIIFDTFLTLSIDSSFVNQGFIDSSWTTVRDFSNMLFIFILLYTGVQTILGIGDWRKTVLFVVVMALLINFSLFFTKVVIDSGNVLAVGIFNSMGSPIPADEQNFQTPGSIQQRDVSASLADAFAPQQFLNVVDKVPALQATIVFLVAAIVSGFAGYIFLKAGLLFVGRLIAFWFLMIVSPFAFISIALPGKANKFHEWVGLLVSQTFVAPVFLFLIYLIMKVLSSGNGILSGVVKISSDTSNFTFDKVLEPVIIAIMLIAGLKLALEFAEDMSGKFGKLGSDIVGGITGVAAGVATGGASMIGRATGGRLAQSLYESGTFQKMATGETAAGRMLGRQLIGLNEKARTGTWDARGIGAVQQAAKIGGVSHLGKPSEGAKGGFEGAMKRQDQADKKFTEKLKVTDAEKEKVTGHTKEKVEMQKEIVGQKTAAVQAAQIAVDTMRSSGKLDPNITKVLEAAQKEEEEAKKALVAAETEAEKAKARIEEEEKRRQGMHANYLEGQVRRVASLVATGGAYSHKQAQRTAEKIREGGKDAKPSDSGKELAELVKKIKEEVKKDEDHK